MQFKNVTTTFIILALFLLKLCSLSAQEKSALNGPEVLKRSIAFHDPKGNWPSFHQKLYFHAKEPEDTAIYEQVFLDNRVSFFGHISKMDGKKIEKGVRDTIFFSSINGDTSINAEDRKKYRLSKRAITSARNSYLFLYGLPMKMLDNGITIRPEVEIDTFNGKKYYVIKADFDKKIGNDSWMLYINPATFAMEGYRFSHNRKPNDGEYIICQNIINVQGIKIPQVRYWHSNADGSYIATDIVEKSAPYSWSKKKGNALPQ